MHWWIAVLLGLAVNLDNLCAGARYGRAGRRMPVGTNAVVALFSGAFAGAGCAIAGWMAGGTASTPGALVLAGLGAYALCGAGGWRVGDLDAPDAEPAPLGGWETAALGVGLATNCLGASFALGLGGASWLGLGAVVALCSFAMVEIGGQFGARGIHPCGVGQLYALRGLLLIAAALGLVL